MALSATIVERSHVFRRRTQFLIEQKSQKAKVSSMFQAMCVERMRVLITQSGYKAFDFGSSNTVDYK